MTAITVANEDWSVVEAVRDALAGATISGEAVFDSVTVTTSASEARQCQLHGSRMAILRYVTTREDDSPEDLRGGCVLLELLLVALVDSTQDGESARLQEALRLKNAAVNAVEAAPPEGSCAWGDGDHYHRRIEWGRPELDTAVEQPWVVCKLPLEVGLVLESPTSH